MINDQTVLKIWKKELLPEYTHAYQAENGMVYYLNYASPKRLYVITEGNEINAKIPDDTIHCAIYGNAIYFKTRTKTYKAVFSPNEGITVSYLGDVVKGNKCYPHEICTRRKEGKMHVYRMCDDPNKDGIFINSSEEELEGLGLIGIHRRKAIFFTHTPSKSRRSVRKLGENAMVVELPYLFAEIIAIDSSRFIYILNEGLLIIDTETMQFLPELQFDGIHVGKLLIVKNGEITVIGLKGKDMFLATARLPIGYYENSPTHVKSKTVAKKYEHGKEEDCNDEEIKEYSSKFANEFTVTQIIGQGGFGCVFKAVNNLDECEYAVKRIAVDVREMKEALVEVRVMAKLDHINIVRYNAAWIEEPPEGWQHDSDAGILKKLGLKRRRLMNFEDDNAFIYIHMQLCNHSLSDWLDQNDTNPRELSRMKRWFKQIVSAVEYIHKKNLIHRDLKPSNVLFAENEILKLCDLGIATERNDDEKSHTTITRTSIGTLLYMSPEQRSLQPYSSKSDVFTLGLILAELCVAMTSTNRTQIFDKFRRGEQVILGVDERAARFIA